MENCNICKILNCLTGFADFLSETDAAAVLKETFESHQLTSVDINGLQWDLETFSLEKSIVKISQSRLFTILDFSKPSVEQSDLKLNIFLNYLSPTITVLTQFSKINFVGLLCKLYLPSWEDSSEGTFLYFVPTFRWQAASV